LKERLLIHSSSSRDPVEILAEEFLQMRRDGVQISIETFALQHSGLASEIRDYFPAVLMLETLAPPSQSHHAQTHYGQLEHGQLQLPTHNIAPPTGLATFEIQREIGRGGMGVVYEARQHSLQRRVALKVLSPGVMQSPAQIARFEREAHLAARLHHTNIVPVFERGRSGDTHYFAMQLIEGPSLEKLIATESPLIAPQTEEGFRNVARLGQQAASALEYSHRLGVIHRDIKPANLLVDEAGDVWITDFGLAKATGNTNITAPGSAVGTLRYMAPEQIDGCSSPHSDIYSLGATLYELLTGQPAFQGANRAALVAAVSAGSTVQPRRINAAIPRDLENIVCKALATCPTDRYTDAGALADDLQRFCNHQPVKACRTSTFKHAVKWARRKPQVATLAAVSFTMFLLALSATTAAYFSTAAALTRETQQRRRAEAATKRADIHRLQAEDNLAISLRALREISAEASGGLQQAGQNHEAWGRLGVVSPEVRNIMQTTLDFHRELVARNHHRDDLTAGLARVLAHAGEVHQRFGDYQAAGRSYQQALELFDELEQHGCNDLVECESLSMVLKLAALRQLEGKFKEAESLYFSVQSKLEQVLEADPASANATFRMAELHLQLSQLYHAQGSIRKWSRENAKAVRLLVSLDAEEPGNQAYQFLLAQAYANWPPFTPGDRDGTARQDNLKAIAILKSLVAANPKAPGYQYELSRTYARVHIWRPHRHRRKEVVPREELLAAQKRLRAALRISRELTAEYPRVPGFFEASAAQMTKLAHICSLLGETEQASRLHQRAVNRAESLVQLHPTAAQYHDTLAGTLFWHGQFIANQCDIEKARVLVSRSVAERRVFLQTVPEHPRATSFLREQLQWLAKHP